MSTSKEDEKREQRRSQHPEHSKKKQPDKGRTRDYPRTSTTSFEDTASFREFSSMSDDDPHFSQASSSPDRISDFSGIFGDVHIRNSRGAWLTPQGFFRKRSDEPYPKTPIDVREHHEELDDSVENNDETTVDSFTSTVEAPSLLNHNVRDHLLHCSVLQPPTAELLDESSISITVKEPQHLITTENRHQSSLKCVYAMKRQMEIMIENKTDKGLRGRISLKTVKQADEQLVDLKISDGGIFLMSNISTTITIFVNLLEKSEEIVLDFSVTIFNTEGNLQFIKSHQIKLIPVLTLLPFKFPPCLNFQMSQLKHSNILWNWYETEITIFFNVPKELKKLNLKIWQQTGGTINKPIGYSILQPDEQLDLEVGFEDPENLQNSLKKPETQLSTNLKFEIYINEKFIYQYDIPVTVKFN